MSASNIAEDTLPAPPSPPQQTARLIKLIGLTLALGYLIVLGGLIGKVIF